MWNFSHSIPTVVQVELASAEVPVYVVLDLDMDPKALFLVR